MPIFEVTQEDIEAFDDVQLRELVKRLAAAELTRFGQPISALTAGGDQNAKDGGIDVRIALPDEVRMDFVQRANTIFQAKATAMEPAKIRSEMCPPKGAGPLRESIRELADQRGAYIIVSSGERLSPPMLKNRLKAMRDCAAEAGVGEHLLLDIYDPSRLASWVGQYAGVALWVRETRGRPVEGWRGAGRWSSGPESASYVYDETRRFIDRRCRKELTASEGIDALRETLAEPGKAARLVGLSGVGKTRLLDAVFDEAIGRAPPLSKAHAVYTAMGRSVIPSPESLIDQLTQSRMRAIVVVENCDAALHGRLVARMGEANGYVSLVTTDHDASFDNPFATAMFELRSASRAVLVRALVELRPGLDSSTYSRIAEFAGGNAGVARALASTLSLGDTLGSVTDRQLVRRLFLQDGEQVEKTMGVARVLSLFYMFNGAELEKPDAHLMVIAKLASLDVHEVYQVVRGLEAQDLVQSRDIMCMLVPHGIANALAKEILESIHLRSMLSEVEKSTGLTSHLIHRLSYLHHLEQAATLAGTILQSPSFAGHPTALDGPRLADFFRLSPLAPRDALALIDPEQSGAGGALQSRTRGTQGLWIRTLQALAYRSSEFDWAAAVLLRFASSVTNGTIDAELAFEELFHAQDSQTLAPGEQRREFLRRELAGNDVNVRRTAFCGLKGLLECEYFNVVQSDVQPAHPDRSGLRIETEEDARTWYGDALALVSEQIALGEPNRELALAVLAKQFRPLWRRPAFREQLSGLCAQAANSGGWPDGWLQLKAELRDRCPDELEPKRLQALAELLQPTTLAHRIDAHVLTKTFPHALDDGLEEADELQRRLAMDERVRQLGDELAADETLLGQLLPRLCAGADGVLYLGEGVGRSSTNAIERWREIRRAWVATDPRNPAFLAGYVLGVRQRSAVEAEEILDFSVTDGGLSEAIPALHRELDTERAANRVLRHLRSGWALAPAFASLSLPCEGSSELLSLCNDVVRGIAGLLNGVPVAAAMVSDALRVFRRRFPQRDLPGHLVETGRYCLIRLDFKNGVPHQYEQRVAELMKRCWSDRVPDEEVQGVLERFISVLHAGGGGGDGSIPRAFFKTRPRLALEAMVGKGLKFSNQTMLRHLRYVAPRLLQETSDDDLSAWLNIDPDARAPRLAKDVDLVEISNSQLELTPRATQLLARVETRPAVLGVFAERIRTEPQAESAYVGLLSRLSNSAELDLASWAKQLLSALRSRQRDSVRSIS